MRHILVAVTTTKQSNCFTLNVCVFLLKMTDLNTMCTAVIFAYYSKQSGHTYCSVQEEVLVLKRYDYF